MKKLLLSFLSLMGLGFSAFAQSHINIELLSATYTTPAVQFRVSWDAIPAVDGETHNAKIWLWVDFRKIENNQPSGSWTRATVANPSTGTLEAGNDKGFWLQGNSGSYSQTVTVTLTNISQNTKFNWCAYASDCPPNVTANNGTYTLYGTPPFILTAADGTATQTVEATTIATSAVTITPVTLTDQTGCPGVFCIYTGSDLYIDGTHLCQQRASGARNWEAWIKDTRDDELYRIVYMPDSKWWLAQNVKYKNVGSAISGCTVEECGKSYTWAQVYASYAGGSSASSGNVQGICPPDWLLPVRGTFSALASSIGTAAQVCAALRPINSSCSPISNTYGYASVYSVTNGAKENAMGYWYTNDAGREDGCGIDGYQSPACNTFSVANAGDSGTRAVVRCFRLL